MAQVHAPYHFVPLSKWVYMPDWAHLVSHDVPFENGLSGTIDYTLVNQTPLCVGQEHVKQDNAPTGVKWTKDPQGNPIIPGSSIKGMLRSVLEIASFGKFGQVDNSHLSYRDVSSHSEYLDTVSKKSKVEAAWLRFDTDRQKWQLHLCQFAKVRHGLIQSQFGVALENEEPATVKYAKFPLTKEVFVTPYKKTIKGKDFYWADDLKEGKYKAHMVFCNHRVFDATRADPKDYDFSYCFYGEHRPVSVADSILEELVQKCFKSHDEKQVNYLQKHAHAEFGMPVFALLDKQGKTLKSLGLARMPRLMYQHDFHSLAQNWQKDALSEHVFDLAECMFGTLRDKGLSLKSRISFSDARLANKTKCEMSPVVTLGGPKPSFLATYVEQKEGSNEYIDYNAKYARLSGWKRYVAQPGFSSNYTGPKSADEEENTEVQSKLEFVAVGTQFRGRIVFHNLLPEELGALLWTIKFGKQADVHHQLGHGRSLGAGLVKIQDLTLNNAYAEQSASPEALINGFEQHMNARHPQQDTQSWTHSPQIQHLLAMANPTLHTQRNLRYIPYEQKAKDSQYRKIQNSKTSLPGLTVNDELLGRMESTQVSDTGSASFAKGRLCELVDKKTEASIWFKDKLFKSKRYERERDEVLESQREADRITQLQSSSGDRRGLDDVLALRETLKTVERHVRPSLNSKIFELLGQVVEGEMSLIAAQELIAIASDEDVSDYLSAGKKKIKDYQRKLKAAQQFVEQST
ncbi:hypothetical protein PRUB_a5215 [Pseudoalteromonas rubra]|uniref:CRISPR type III-associated protein domain-containing protein n=1 Tax=Pseudoalteromonas rubra TaxID=43658 RepID=A0A8T0CAK2_9GAMM|nr:TIGR03986 family CRISPR-associated RAMP protein [Pseudoalteromonas rubra]KAF7787716.1 hypothetical protein PRUB_a5215 [Pseudoalteromonas rubra]